MVSELSQELLDHANLLLTLPPNQACLRRAVSAAYYSLFHLLIRETVSKWSDLGHQARIARIFDHERMKKVSAAVIKSLETGTIAEADSMQATHRIELMKVARSFIILQQARHDADYNLAKPLDPADALTLVNRANSAFAAWAIARKSEAANEYLFSLLFKDRERS